MNNWKPVTNTEPQRGTRVLIASSELGWMEIATATRLDIDEDEDVWLLATGYPTELTMADYWMPLPEPPKQD